MAKTEDERVAGATVKERTVGRGWELFEPFDVAYERGEIDEAEWHRRVGAIISPAYLAATDPCAQSGSASTPAEWEQARRFLFAIVNRDGTFRDVGCANGHLMECAAAWLAEDGYRIEPYGLEIQPKLAALARRRLPHWADRIAIGNALHWVPDQPFDFVRAGLEFVPSRLQPQLVRYLLDVTVAPGGRLIAGTPPKLEGEVAVWGFRVGGHVEVPHARDYRVVRRAFSIDKSA